MEESPKYTRIDVTAVYITYEFFFVNRHPPPLHTHRFFKSLSLVNTLRIKSDFNPSLQEETLGTELE